jgi:hypothetical protein
MKSKLILYSPWKKVGIASLCVFIFSLGYELHILGHAFPNFSGMPAAWMLDGEEVAATRQARAEAAQAAQMAAMLEQGSKAVKNMGGVDETKKAMEEMA